MDETANEIETEIDRARDRLGYNVRALEEKVDSAADWREHFRERPQLFLGAAFAGGVILASTFRTTPSAGTSVDVRARRSVDDNGVRAQASELWHNVQRALIGVASARIKEYIGQLVPGFGEHYRRAEQRAAGFDPTTHSLGRTTG